MADVLHGDEVHDHGQAAGARPRRRTRNQGRRGRTVRFALTDAEYAELSDAARRPGWHAARSPPKRPCRWRGAWS